MAKNKGNDKKVEQITDMEVDFAQWFTDVCKKAQLIDYSSMQSVGRFLTTQNRRTSLRLSLSLRGRSNL